MIINSVAKLAIIACATIGVSANALTISVLSGNLAGFEYDVDEANKTIGIQETWGPNTWSNVRLLFSDLGAGDYHVYKVVHNDTGNVWTSFGNELLHGDGTPSPDSDGLSFAQGSNIDRTATAFSSLFTDELGLRDYLNWYNPPSVPSGHFVVFEYGLRDNIGANNPFILSQIANVPEPAAWALLITGFAMIGASLRQRRANVVTA